MGELEDEGHGDEDLYPFYIYESYSLVPIRVTNSVDRSDALVRGGSEFVCLWLVFPYIGGGSSAVIDSSAYIGGDSSVAVDTTFSRAGLPRRG